MIVYGDTSALVKIILVEDGHEAMRQLVDSCDRLFSVSIAYVGLRAALAAAFRAARLKEEQRSDALTALEHLWGRVSEIQVDGPLVRQAGELAERYALRGYDALHLAAFLNVFDIGDMTFACYDLRLASAATAVGCRRVFPVI